MRHLRQIIVSVLLVSAFSGLVLAEVASGDKAPDFTLQDTAGQEHQLQQYLDAGKIVVLEWFNPDCPFIGKHHKTARTMNETFAAVKDDDVVWLAINSSAPGKEGAGLKRNREAHKNYEMPFPILMDESGKVGRAYEAKTTPHMFVISSEGVVMYNGAIDDNRSPSTLGEVNYVLNALQAVLSGKEVLEPATKPYGCSVKYGK